MVSFLFFFFLVSANIHWQLCQREQNNYRCNLCIHVRYTFTTLEKSPLRTSSFPVHTQNPFSPLQSSHQLRWFLRFHRRKGNDRFGRFSDKKKKTWTIWVKSFLLLPPRSSFFWGKSLCLVETIMWQQWSCSEIDRKAMFGNVHTWLRKQHREK